MTYTRPKLTATAASLGLIMGNHGGPGAKSGPCTDSNVQQGQSGTSSAGAYEVDE